MRTLLYSLWTISILFLQLNFKILYLFSFSISIIFIFIFFTSKYSTFLKESITYLLINIFLYVFWITLSFLLKNNAIYILQDASGLYILFAFLPILLNLNNIKPNIDQFEKLITLGSIAAIIIHILLYFSFYIKYDKLTNISIHEANSFLLNLGTVIKYSTNDRGTLRIDSNLFSVILLSIFINVQKLHKNKKYLFLLIFLEITLYLEGHRALFLFTNIFLFYNLFSMRNSEHSFYKKLLSIAAITFVVIINIEIFITDKINIFLRYFSFIDSNTLISLDNERLEQVEPLLSSIFKAPFSGSGFGSSAKLIRNVSRPFLYELDFLAVIMKIGFLGSILYFGVFAFLLINCYKKRNISMKYISIFSTLLTYLCFSSTNAGLAMSVLSASLFCMSLLYYTILIREEYTSKPFTAFMSISDAGYI